MSKYLLASKNKFDGGGSPGSDEDDSDLYEEALVEFFAEGSSTSSGSSEELNIMPPIEEESARREESSTSTSSSSSSSSTSSSDEDFNASYTDMFFKKENPNKRTSQTVVEGSFDDVNERRPPAKKVTQVVPAAKAVPAVKSLTAAKAVPADMDKSPSKTKSTLAEKRTEEKRGKITSVEKKADDKKAKSTAAQKKTDDKKEKIALAEKKTNGKKEMSTSVEKNTYDNKVKSILARAVDKNGTGPSDEKNVNDKKEKIPSAKKKTVDKKEKSASDEKKTHESKVKQVPAQKERDGQTSDVTLSTAAAASGTNPLFGSWNQNVEEEVLFVTKEPDEPTPRRTGLGIFGSIRRQKSHGSLDEENPDEPASTDGSIKEKKGMFGSLRRHKSRNSSDEVNPTVPVEDETHPDEGENNATLPATKAAPSIEAVQEKKGVFGSLRRISLDSLDEENPALATDNDESSDEKVDTFGGSPSELPMDDTAPDENGATKKGMPNRFLSPFRRGKAANEEQMSRALAVPVGGASYEEGSPANNIAHRDQRTAVTSRQLGVALILAVLVLVGTNIGTSYLGAKLALENVGEKSVVDDKIAGNVTGPCAFEDVYLEFKIRFDSNPGETGAVLRDKGPIGATLWNFGVGAFFSFSQFQRENIFSICLSPALPYEFELTDLGGNGLVGSFIDSVIYGNWQLMYNGELVARYHGDCNEPDLTDCGDFCSCKYSLTADGSEGGCETNCADTV
jgi:hypothetical protein